MEGREKRTTKMRPESAEIGLTTEPPIAPASLSSEESVSGLKKKYVTQFQMCQRLENAEEELRAANRAIAKLTKKVSKLLTEIETLKAQKEAPLDTSIIPSVDLEKTTNDLREALLKPLDDNPIFIALKEKMDRLEERLKEDLFPRFSPAMPAMVQQQPVAAPQVASYAAKAAAWAASSQQQAPAAAPAATTAFSSPREKKEAPQRSSDWFFRKKREEPGDAISAEKRMVIVKVCVAIPLAKGPLDLIDAALAVSVGAGLSAMEALVKEAVHAQTGIKPAFVEVVNPKKSIVKLSVDAALKDTMLQKLKGRATILPPPMVVGKKISGLVKMAKIYLARPRFQALRRAHIMDVHLDYRTPFFQEVEKEIARRYGDNPLLNERSFLLGLVKRDRDWALSMTSKPIESSDLGVAGETSEAGPEEKAVSETQPSHLTTTPPPHHLANGEALEKGESPMGMVATTTEEKSTPALESSSHQEWTAVEKKKEKKRKSSKKLQQKATLEEEELLEEL